MKRILLLSASIGFWASCTNNSFEELSPKDICKDTARAMSFSKDILPMLEKNKCISCHYFPASSQFKNVVLETYDEVYKVVVSGQLHKAINRLPGATPMPYQLPKLDACSISKIEKWLTAGAPNN